MVEYFLTISEDEALALGEHFNRFDDTGDFSFRHPAEYLVLQRVAGQVDTTTPAFFSKNYDELLQTRGRLRRGSALLQAGRNITSRSTRSRAQTPALG